MKIPLQCPWLFLTFGLTTTKILWGGGIEWESLSNIVKLNVWISDTLPNFIWSKIFPFFIQSMLKCFKGQTHSTTCLVYNRVFTSCITFCCKQTHPNAIKAPINNLLVPRFVICRFKLRSIKFQFNSLLTHFKCNSCLFESQM